MFLMISGKLYKYSKTDFTIHSKMLPKINLIEVKSENNEKKYYIEGYVSTIDPDKYNDIVNNKGQNVIFSQLKNSNITMDLDHEEWRSKDGSKVGRKLDKIPVAKIVETKLENKGTWVKALLNDAHPKFENILKSIKNGFLHAFSIAYNAINPIKKIINGIEYRILEDMNIFNVGITGNPVNSDATFKVALKSIKMVDENKQKEKPETKEKTETEKVEEKGAGMDYKAMYKEMKATMMEDVKAMIEPMVKAMMKEQMKGMDKPKAEMKSFEETDSFIELKSKVEKINEILEKPFIKGALESKKVEVKSQSQEDVRFDAMKEVQRMYGGNM